MIETPCIKVCKVCPMTRMCIGCYRTISEITDWAFASDEMKSQIKQRCQERKNEFGNKTPKE